MTTVNVAKTAKTVKTAPYHAQSGRRLVVIGIGHPARGDDAVGHRVAQCLRAAPLDNVTVRLESGDGTRLLEAWHGAEAVILIDAVQSGATAGTVHRLTAPELLVPQAFWRCSTHAFGVAEAIALAHALEHVLELPSCFIVYGIEGETFEVGAPLSAAVAQAVPEVVGRIRRDIRALQAGYT
jgi:hydrogenase maturation protease